MIDFLLKEYAGVAILMLILIGSLYFWLALKNIIQRFSSRDRLSQRNAEGSNHRSDLGGVTMDSEGYGGDE